MPIDNPVEEKELLKNLSNGSTLAFEKLYLKYSARIYGNIIKLVKATDVADDILQDVFVKIWEKRASIDPEKSFKTYLFVCSRHMVIDFFRKVSLEQLAENFLSENGSELYSHVEEDTVFRETGKALDKIIDQLPEKRKMIYKLCKVEGLSYKAVSEQLNISISTVHDHVVKAGRFVKKELMVHEGNTLTGLIFLLLFK
jgi:RNA polymerase sigma-70 factor (family 1)